MNEPSAVHIDRAALAAIDAHAWAELPRECCGLLVGVSADDDRLLHVQRAVATHNVAEQPTRRYLIDPADHFRLLRELRRTDEAIVGVYHSHPVSRPAPSPTDHAEALPNFLYVIVSPHGGGAELGETRAWWLDGGNFREIPLVISS